MKAKANVHPFTPHGGSTARGTHYRPRERDPRLDEVCSLIDKSGLDPSAICARITRLSGGGASVNPSTIHRWLNSPTQTRAYNFGLDWVERVLGYERRLVHVGYKEPKR